MCDFFFQRLHSLALRQSSYHNERSKVIHVSVNMSRYLFMIFSHYNEFWMSQNMFHVVRADEVKLVGCDTVYF